MKCRQRFALRILLLCGAFITAAMIPTHSFALQTDPAPTSSPSAQLATSTVVEIGILASEITSLETRIEAMQTSGVASSAPVFQRSLAIGSSGADVSALQNVLERGGFFTVRTTGYFGGLTESALAAFQQFYGLGPVGFAGPKTRVLLNSIAAIEREASSTTSVGNASGVTPQIELASSTPASSRSDQASASTSSTSIVSPLTSLIPTNTSPGFGGGGAASVSSPPPAAPPSWVLSGAAVDLDFADQQYYGGSLGSLVSISRASPETCSWADGTITYAATDTPCITDLGLAVWQGSTNLLTHSSDLSNAAWTSVVSGSGSVSTTAAAGIAPDGTQTATRVTVSVTSPYNENPTDLAFIRQTFTASVAAYSDSIWLKAYSPSDVGKVIVLGISNPYWDNFEKRVTLTNDWVRYSVQNETLYDPTGQLFVGYVDSRDIPQVGPVSFLAWGAQAELAPSATAYIPTASTTASRAPDVIAASGALQTTLAASTGSLSVRTNGSEPATTGTVVDANGSILLGKTNGDALTTNLVSPLTNNISMSWAGPAASGIAWDATGRSLALNAGTVATDAQAMTPAAPFHLGSLSGSSAFLNGYVTRLTAWPSKVSDSVLTSMPSAGNTTYYVAASGSDSNNGTSPSTPWQTVAKVNAGIYYPGDHILFNGGDAFSGCLVFTGDNMFGTSSDPILVGSYGSGRFTLNANCPYYKSEGLFLSGVGGFTLNNAILAGNGTGTWFGIRVVNPASHLVGDITIENSDISGFYHSGGDYSSEIEIDAWPGGGITRVNILNNTLHGTSGPTSLDENGVNGYGANNMTNFTYQGNTIYNLGGKPGSSAGGNGIVANQVNGAIMQYNVVHDMGANMNTCGGAAGLWADTANNVLIQYNEVYNVQPTHYTGGCDWDGFDLDAGVTNSTLQYNYSHDNWGSGYHLYIAGSWSNNTVRYNISENNATTSSSAGFGGIATVNGGSALNLNIYNNTVISNGPAGTGLFVVQSGNPGGTTVANNIFYSTNGANLITGNGNPTGITFKNNDYYAAGPFKIKWNSVTYTNLPNFQASTTEDTTGTSTNPVFAGTPSAGICNSSSNGSTTPQPCPSIYALQASSTVIGTGLDLTKSPYDFNVGPQDYYGNVVPHGIGTGFNIGAYGGTQ